MMRVILLKDVAKVGHKFEVKNVADGYALNFLIPRGLAKNATEAAMRAVKEQQARIADEAKLQEELLTKNLETLKKSKIIINSKVNDKGHLFAGLDAGDIVVAVQNQTKITLNPEILVLEKPIKEVGEHQVKIVSGTISGVVPVVVEAEK